MTRFVIAVLVLAFVTFVWPTAYRGIAPVHVPRDVFAARENRFTGAVDVLTPIGWYRLEARAAAVVRRDSADDPLRNYRPDWRTR